MGCRKVMLKVYDYEVSAAAMATYKESEQGPGGAGSQRAKSILSSWQRTLTVASSPLMDFQCTALLSNSDVTRYCTVTTRATEFVTSLVSFSQQCKFFFQSQNCGKLYSLVSKANTCHQEDVQCNLVGKNHENLGVLVLH